MPATEADAHIERAGARGHSINALVRFALEVDRVFWEQAGDGYVPHVVHVANGRDRAVWLPEYGIQAVRSIDLNGQPLELWGTNCVES